MYISEDKLLAHNSVLGRGNSTFESPNVQMSLAPRTDMSGRQFIKSGQGAQ